MTTYYVDAVNGNDANSGLTEALAKKTLNGAEAIPVAPGDLVYVEDTGDYTAELTPTVHGTSTAPIVYEGYTSTPGDGGRATINSAGDKCIDDTSGFDYRVYKNFVLTGASSRGTDTVGEFLVFQNCIAHGNTDKGFDVYAHCQFVECEAYNNPIGFSFHKHINLVDCYAHDCTTSGFDAQESDNEFVRVIADTCGIGLDCSGGVNPQDHIQIDGCTIYNCTTGINSTTAVLPTAQMKVRNNTISNCTTGVTAGTLTCVAAFDYNHYSGNTTDVAANICDIYGNTGNAAKGPNDVSGDPLFTDAPNGDFSWPTGSPLKSAGPGTIPSEGVSGSTSSFLSIGVWQPEGFAGAGIRRVRQRTHGV